MEDIKTEKLWLMQGDCIAMLKDIPDNSVDVVIQTYRTVLISQHGI